MSLSKIKHTSQRQLLESQSWEYCIILDGGRADIFEDIAPEYFSLTSGYERVWNHGHTFTATWFAEMFPNEYNAHCYHGGLPIHAFENNPHNYDESNHFDSVANYDRYEWHDEFRTCPPEGVTGLVRNDQPDRAVIRYLQPHNPYRTLTIHSHGDARSHSPSELRSAYIDNYRWVMENVRNELLPMLSGTSIITSDHGQCLGDCQQYLHGLNKNRHDHLVEVPWLVIEL